MMVVRPAISVSMGLLDPLLCLCVDVGRGLIQDEDPGVKGQGAGKGEQLPLPGGEGGSPLGDLLVVARRKPLDETAGVDLPGGLHDGLIRDILIAQADVAADVPGEDEHVLLDLSDGPADLVPAEVFDVDAVNEDLALLDVVIPADEVQNGALARAGGAHEGHLLSRLNDEAHVPEDEVFVVVGEPDVPELNAAPDFRRLHRLLRVVNQGLLVQQGEDLLRRGHGGLEGGQLLRQVLDGFKEGLDVLQENIHSAEGHRPRQHAVAAAGNHDGHSHHGGEHDNGPEHGVDHDGPEAGPVMGLAVLGEFLIFPLLPIEDLDDLHAGEVFRQEGVQRGQAGPHFPVGPEGEGPGEHRQHRYQRHHDEAQQRHAHIQGQHDHRQSQNLHHVPEQLHQDVGVQLVDRLHVVGDPGEHLAHGTGLKILHGHAVDFLRNLPAEPEAELLRYLRHHQPLYKGQQCAQSIQTQQKEQNLPDPPEIDPAGTGEFGHHTVEQLRGSLCQHLGADDVEDRAACRKNHHGNQGKLVSAHVCQ